MVPHERPNKTRRNRRGTLSENQRQSRDAAAREVASSATNAYLGAGAMFNLGGNPHATRDWSVPRHR
jgi:hypothetical protein